MLRPSSNSACLAGTKLYPQARKELELIRHNHRTLAPTGCTTQFCQAGRATHLNEPRVGRDRPLEEIKEEAANFLRDCADNGIIGSAKELDQRIQHAFHQIEASAIQTTVTDAHGNQFEGRAGGTWEQSYAELAYGLRTSWRNAKRCIMRSEYSTLGLCDLRHITTSREMAVAIIERVKKAFNNGRIEPTVFLFPPRQPGQRGPMIWNSQILAFAGYQDDGDSSETILGDPASTDLTRSMIDLGWVPPFPRSRWDVLPLVTMAEGDSPYMMELPPELKRTVKIVHPQYLSEFESLDLRWVVAPALSRLGFDIGGNQYTASPFIGWFMDAEIGVRDLADEHRYNVLPAVVQALRLNNLTQADVEDLPEDERLLVLSRAQAELNFAVNYSYRQESVMMSDSLSSSTIYMEFDQQRKAELGYSLPADPYWLAPPQGSIIPIWHRGATPNYQPKPMICRHVQDPVKAWNRQAPDHKQVALRPAENKVEKDMSVGSARVRIVWCSAGVSAAKIARRLYKGLKNTSRNSGVAFKVDRPQTLNSLSLEQTRPEDVILIITSTHGEGEVPANGIQFVKKYHSNEECKATPKFSVFGHGDRSYGDTYNAAAKSIHDVFSERGCVSVTEGYFSGDSSTQNPDWAAFDRWYNSIIKHILGSRDGISKFAIGSTDSVDSQSLGRTESNKSDDSKNSKGSSTAWTGVSDTDSQTTHGSTIVNPLPGLSSATLLQVRRPNNASIIQVTLDVGHFKLQEMGHVRILCPNLDTEVMRAMVLLGLGSHDTLEWNGISAFEFFSRTVDLERPFKTLDWYPKFKDLGVLKQHDLRHSRVNDVLRSIVSPVSREMLHDVCKDMQSIQPRIYSVASSPSSLGAPVGHMDILVQKNTGGRFSDRWLTQARNRSQLQFSMASADAWPMIEAQKQSMPLIMVSTGSGIAPIRAVLQRRCADARKQRQGAERSISLFVGCKQQDEELMREIVQPAQEAGLFKVLKIVPSNAAKIRVQDKLLLPEVRKGLAQDLEHPQAIVFICANGNAAKGTATNLSKVAGKDIKYAMQDRYATEVFDG